MEEKKHYVMPGAELTDEQRESIKKHQEEQEQQNKELLERQVQLRKEKTRFTIEQLLATTINPTEDRVVVYPDPIEELTEGGLLKPQEVIDKERALIGTVVAVGPGLDIERTVTNNLLLNMLRYASDIPEDELKKLQEKYKLSRVPYAPGERVLYGRYAGTPVQDPTTKAELLIMRPPDIFAKL